MSKESLEKIFVPLYSTKTLGIGLGLPILNEIITKHKGKIEVESEMGKGTTFTIFFPLMPIASGNITSEKKNDITRAHLGLQSQDILKE